MKGISMLLMINISIIIIIITIIIIIIIIIITNCDVCAQMAVKQVEQNFPLSGADFKHFGRRNVP
jgi:hypothetical protein